MSTWTEPRDKDHLLWILGGAVGGAVSSSIAAFLWMPDLAVTDVVGCCFGGAFFGLFTGYLPAVYVRLLCELACECHGSMWARWLPFWIALVGSGLTAALIIKTFADGVGC
jgi:hypothetical protein